MQLVAASRVLVSQALVPYERGDDGLMTTHHVVVI